MKRWKTILLEYFAFGMLVSGRLLTSIHYDARVEYVKTKFSRDELIDIMKIILFEELKKKNPCRLRRREKESTQRARKSKRKSFLIQTRILHLIIKIKIKACTHKGVSSLL